MLLVSTSSWVFLLQRNDRMTLKYQVQQIYCTRSNKTPPLSNKPLYNKTPVCRVRDWISSPPPLLLRARNLITPRVKHDLLRWPSNYWRTLLIKRFSSSSSMWSWDIRSWTKFSTRCGFGIVQFSFITFKEEPWIKKTVQMIFWESLNWILHKIT